MSDDAHGIARRVSLPSRTFAQSVEAGVHRSASWRSPSLRRYRTRRAGAVASPAAFFTNSVAGMTAPALLPRYFDKANLVFLRARRVRDGQPPIHYRDGFDPFDPGHARGRRAADGED